jgi:hypothetical protein
MRAVKQPRRSRASLPLAPADLPFARRWVVNRGTRP